MIQTFHNTIQNQGKPIGLPLVICAILLFSCAGSNRSSSRAAYKPDFIYKNWFFNPPENTAVGFKSVLGEPLYDGAVRLNGTVHTRVEGFKQEYYEANLAHSQDSVFFYYDTSSANKVKNNMVILDSIRMGPFYAILVGTEDIPVDKTKLKIHKSFKLRKKKKEKNKEGRIYESFTVPFSYYNQHNAWVTAEESAVKLLCEQVVANFASISNFKGNKDSSRLEEAYRTSFDLTIKNIRVTERYYDPFERTFNVTVSLDKSEVKPTSK